METQEAIDARSEQNTSHSILVKGMWKSAREISRSRSRQESLEQIVKDLWIIVSHGYEQLKLYMEPQGLWADWLHGIHGYTWRWRSRTHW